MVLAESVLRKVVVGKCGREVLGQKFVEKCWGRVW